VIALSHRRTARADHIHRDCAGGRFTRKRNFYWILCPQIRKRRLCEARFDNDERLKLSLYSRGVAFLE
jgi:hypothetical protein